MDQINAKFITESFEKNKTSENISDILRQRSSGWKWFSVNSIKRCCKKNRIIIFFKKKNLFSSKEKSNKDFLRMQNWFENTQWKLKVNDFEICFFFFFLSFFSDFTSLILMVFKPVWLSCLESGTNSVLISNAFWGINQNIPF